MQALADLTLKELSDRKRALKARMVLRTKAIKRAQADRSEAELILGGVEREIERRAKLAKGNSRPR